MEEEKIKHLICMLNKKLLNILLLVYLIRILSKNTINKIQSKDDYSRANDRNGRTIYLPKERKKDSYRA